MDTDWRFIGR